MRLIKAIHDSILRWPGLARLLLASQYIVHCCLMVIALYQCSIVS